MNALINGVLGILPDKVCTGRNVLTDEQEFRHMVLVLLVMMLLMQCFLCMFIFGLVAVSLGARRMK